MAFSEGQRSRAYRVIVDALTTDGILGREIKSWKVGRGSREEQALAPSSRTRPMITLMPTTSGADFADSCSVQTALVVLVRIDLDGTDYSRILDLWEHLEGVVLSIPPGDWDGTGVISALPELGRSKIGDDQSITAEAEIKLDMFINR